nr:uncharacterized protein LOC104110653 [Nicotiana tomentosiformis]
MHVGNKFAVLEVEEIGNENLTMVQKQIQVDNNVVVVQNNGGDHEANNQLVVIEDGNNRTLRPSPVPTGKTLVNANNVQKHPNPTPKDTRIILNPKTPSFIPTSSEINATKEANVTKKDNHDHELLEEEINFTGGRLWCDHEEDDSDEGDLSEGYEEKDNAILEAEDEPQGAEISVNGKTNKDDVHTVEKVPKKTDASTEVEAPIEPIDPGDSGGGEKQQSANKVIENQAHATLELVQNPEGITNTKSLNVAEWKIKENAEKSLIPKPAKNPVVAPQQQKQLEDNTAGKGRDLDAESTCKNLMNVARQGDLSP